MATSNPADIAAGLNSLQHLKLAGLKVADLERMLDPIHAIQFALEQFEGIEFLRSWNEGDWQSCAHNWPEWLTFKQ